MFCAVYCSGPGFAFGTQNLLRQRLEVLVARQQAEGCSGLRPPAQVNQFKARAVFVNTANGVNSSFVYIMAHWGEGGRVVLTQALHLALRQAEGCLGLHQLAQVGLNPESLK
jgi:hypothetical protein